MEFLAGMVAGTLLLPWWGLSLLVILFLIDAALVENDRAGLGTFLMLVGIVAVIWTATDYNPFVLAWDNLANLISFFSLYFVVGAVWSMVKWYFYLINVREDMIERNTKERPHNSYASNNKGRIMSWVGHWPFSMIGTLVGDFLTKILRTIYETFSSVYERIEKKIFKDFA